MQLVSLIDGEDAPWDADGRVATNERLNVDVGDYVHSRESWTGCAVEKSAADS